MPTIFSHALVGAAVGTCCLRAPMDWRLLAIGAACAVLPDLDVVGLAVGFGLDHPLGHRGLSHSVPFAAAFAAVLTALAPAPIRARAVAWRLWLFLCLAVASHGVLDAFTNGGRGVAFWAPFSDVRYHAPFRPIEISPIGIGRFLGPRGIVVMANELVWIWLPVVAIALGVRALRTRSAASSTLDQRIQSP